LGVAGPVMICGVPVAAIAARQSVWRPGVELREVLAVPGAFPTGLPELLVDEPADWLPNEFAFADELGFADSPKMPGVPPDWAVPELEVPAVELGFGSTGALSPEIVD
jgi:hypothetical protein